MLRMSTLFLRTLREDPADAEVPSHKLLVRGGFVRRISPGIFSWLPLGYQVYRNVERIIREEMNHAGFQEVHFPALLPREPYEATSRWNEYGPTLFRLQDRKDVDYLLGPTHEEMFTLMVKGEYSSYKDLPVSLYQIQTKFRDEARPRAGILRGREFVMKDSYSFDIDEAGLALSYEKHRQAYIKTFERLGLEFVIVSATSGAMGGSASEEFLAPCEIGEDTFVQCSSCGHAANVEAIVTPSLAQVDASDVPAFHEEATPGASSISDLVEFSNTNFGGSVTAADTLKCVVVMLTHIDGSQSPLVVGLPGDRELDVKRLEAAVHPATARPFEDVDFAKYGQLVKGFIGPQILGTDSQSGIRFAVDPRVAVGTSWISGANKVDTHVYDLVAGRDFSWDEVVDAAEIREGDSCAQCSAPLNIARGIEIGHIFQLGRKYAEALDLKVLDENGKLVTVTMGSYGIGVSRAVAAIAEQSHDEKGLIWPREVAPADVHIVATGKDDEVFSAADELAQSLESSGIRVLIDDRRGVSPGVKFNDSELLGVPTIVVVGKGLADGVVEVRDRHSGAQANVEFAKAHSHIVEVVSG